ncbi:hypothetical protein [Occallatibacter savannae]|uniref:hypothetical protein n=1 Tax=Occallatibacter savannae TaxID=1002691 RepID=UPI0013A52E80|nr:hypothetical protein [Occallatibacter savannae]
MTVGIGFVSCSQAQTADALWFGEVQCTLSMQMPGYTHQETQTWRLTGEAPKMSGSIAVYPATWIVTSSGSGQRTVNAQFTASDWKSNATPLSAPLAMFVRVNGALVIKSYHSQLSAAKAVTITRQVSLPGATPAQSSTQSAVGEWTMPAIEVAAPGGNIAGTGTTAIGGSSIPERPGGSPQTANCTWHFTRATSGTPPTVTLPVASPTHLTLSSSSSSTSPQGSSTSGTANSSSATGSQTTTPVTNGALQMTAPTIVPSAGALTISWAAPANNGGDAVDSYDLEVNLTAPSGTATTTSTIAAPNTTYRLQARACPDTPAACQAPNFDTYRFRIRAHNSSGYGAYTDYTGSVRPMLSYMQDVYPIFTRLQCAACHSRQNGGNVHLYLDDPPSVTYQSVKGLGNIVNAVQPANSYLLTYPSHILNTHCGSNPPFASPNPPAGATPEYWVILQWIRDGAPF